MKDEGKEEWKIKKMNNAECEKFKMETESTKEIIEIWKSNASYQEKYSERNSKVLQMKRRCVKRKKRKENQ